MGALEKFLGNVKEVEIEGKKIKIYPLKVKDMNKFAKQNPTKEESEKISREILKLSIPDATEEEIDNLAINEFVLIMEEINKLNGFKDERLNRLKELSGQRASGN